MLSGTEILNLPMPTNDAEAKTIGDYLRTLLSTLWDREESFSGKRPFGNSGWQHDIYSALIAGYAVAGTLDDEGYVLEIDTAAADACVQAAISSMR